MTPLEWYDPRDYGALCDQCALRHEGSGPVPPETHQGALLWVVAEGPGKCEIELKRPLVGSSGGEHDRAIDEAGYSRSSASYTNTILCRHPGAPNVGLLQYLASIRKRNKRRIAAGEPPLLLPTEACRPRLIAELEQAPALLLMGAFARGALASDLGEGRGEEGLSRSRGFPTEARIGDRFVPALSTLHPAAVLRRRRMTVIYRSDVAKAYRMATGRLTWSEPEMVFFPTIDELRNLLTQFDASGRPVSYDVETRPGDGLEFDSRTDVLRCIGIGTDKLLTCVPYESVEQRRRYTPDEERARDELLLAWFAERGKAVSAHNELYDRQVMISNIPGFEMGRAVFDTVIAHHVVWSELPHDLGFCVAQYTDAPQHKNVNHDAWASDYELHKYCMLDVGHTSYLAEQLARDKRLREQRRAFQVDLGLSRVCREMHNIGMAIDITERDWQYKVKSEEMERYQAESRVWAVRALEGVEHTTPAMHKLACTLNPASPQQLGRYLFDVCGITPLSEKEGGITSTGEPATSKDVLFALIDKGLPEQIEEFLLRVIDYKEAHKLRGTYCTIEPSQSDGRVHPNWLPHVVVSGRLSCSAPNAMNVPYSMRGIYCAGPGHVLVVQDKSGLEARLAAILSGLKWQIDLFKNGGDLHAVTARMLLKIAEDEELPDKKRKFGKTFRFACQYGAKEKKVCVMVRNFRDPKTGEREFRRFKLSEAEATHQAFWANHVELMAYHEANIEGHEQVGFIAEPLHGRRRYFLDAGGDSSIREEQMNYPIQSAAAADVNDATFRLVDEFPWGFDGPSTGLVHQCHDALMIECREENAEKVAIRMQEVLYSEVGGMPLPVDISIGKSWGSLVSYKRVGDHLEAA